MIMITLPRLSAKKELRKVKKQEPKVSPSSYFYLLMKKPLHLRFQQVIFRLTSRLPVRLIAFLPQALQYRNKKLIWPLVRKKVLNIYRIGTITSL